MIMKRLLTLFAALFMCAAMFVSCNGNGGKAVEPSTAFTTYIKAYTGGMVSSGSSVRIEFAAPVKTVEDASLFSFSPSVKGSVRWISDSVVEFTPDGTLEPGTNYRASFNLASVTDVKDPELKKFNFSFMVAPKSVLLSSDGVLISSSDPSKASVACTANFSEAVSAESVRQMLSFSYGEGAPQIEVLTDGSSNVINFVVTDLVRSGKDRELTVRLNASKLGFKGEKQETVTIPGTGDFRVISAELHEGADPYVDVRFSEPLDNGAAEKGFFTISNVGRQYVQLNSNQAKVFFDSMPSDKLELRVSSLVRSYSDATLSSDYVRSFDASAIRPEVQFAFNGNILPDRSELILPFKAIGLRSVELRVIKIYENNILMFLQDNSLSEGMDIRRSGRQIYKSTVYLDSDPSKDVNRWEEYSVDLSDMFRKEPGAIYRIRLSYKLENTIYSDVYGASGNSLVNLSDGGMSKEEMDVWDIPYAYYYDSSFDWELYDWNDTENPRTPSYYMESYRFPECNLLASNLGIIVKSSDSGKLWVSVNDILSTDPVSGAELTAYNYQLQKVGEGKTDSDGFAEIPLSGKAFALVARSGKTTGYIRVVDGEEKSLSRFDTGGQALSSGLKGFVYGERGVWRPGDTLHVSLMIEDREKLIPESHPVTMELYNPQGQFYTKTVNTQGLKGLYVFNVPTRETDPTGTWHAYFKVGGASFHKSLHIETIKANRLKVSDTIKGSYLKAGTSTPFEINASWLTGPAASGLKTVVEMTLSRKGGSFKGYEKYVFNNPVSEFHNSSYTVFEGKLDGSGKAVTNVNMPKVSGAPGMLSANIVTRVMEPGGDASIYTHTVPFAPYDSFVGVGLENGETYETDTDIRFPAVVVDPEGKAVSGHKLEYRIYKLDWSWWWESGRESLDSYVNGNSASPVSQGTFTSASKPVDINFRVDYPGYGRYLVYVKDLTGGHASGGIVYVDWPSWRGHSDKSDPTALSMLSFNTDKKEYSVGEEITVFIPAAEGGRALVSLENGRGVISRSWVKTSDGQDTRFKFKVTADMAPNFYIHVSLLQKHKRERNDLPIRLYGVQAVTVNNKDSHLEPLLNMPDVIRPQEEFTVAVREKNGKPMTYTLAIVDEGLLDITSFRTPDPWAAMNAREALGVRTWDLYDNVIGAYSGRFAPLMSIGGDIDLQMGNKKDNRFNPVVKFYGPFTLNKGEQKHKITLPMYVGSVRVMVVAGQNGAYGNAEKAVPVRSPLMILPTLPRTLSTGENVVLPVNVFAMEDNMRNVKVSVVVDGPLTVSSSSTQSLSFSAPGDKLAGFTLAAGEKEGKAQVIINAESGSYKAREVVDIEVRNPNPPAVSAQGMMIKEGKSAKFSFTPFVAGDNASAKIQLSNFPSIDFDGLFRYAESYPYDCSEQLASKGMTLVYTKQFLSQDNAAKADAMISSIMQELYARQLPDGGFAYWPGQAFADEWATSMAGQFLTEASNSGYSVNKAVLSSWKKFQKKLASNYKHSDKYKQYDLQQAYRLYTLALVGSAEEGAMNRMKAAPDLTVQARWRLAAAYAVAGKKNVAKQLIEKLETSITDQTPSYFTYGSGKDNAMLLETAVLTDEMQVAMDLAEDVASVYRNGGFGTQYAAFAALAMNRLAGKVGDSVMEVSVVPSEGKTMKSAKSSFSFDVDPSEGSIELKNLSKGSVYASLQMRRPVSFSETVPARNSNISLNVQYTDMAGNSIDPARLSQGQDFVMNIIVASSSIAAVAHEGLALTAMVPSGWEIFNERLYNAAAETDEGCSYKDIRDDRVIWYFDLPASGRRIFRMRLQAAYAGEFVLPSVSCEAMYDPETYANTASGKTVVTQ